MKKVELKRVLKKHGMLVGLLAGLVIIALIYIFKGNVNYAIPVGAGIGIAIGAGLRK